MYKPSYTQSKSQTCTMDSELSRASNKIIQDLNDLRNDAQTLKQDLKGATHAVGDAVRHTGGQVRDVGDSRHTYTDVGDREHAQRAYQIGTHCHGDRLGFRKIISPLIFCRGKN